MAKRRRADNTMTKRRRADNTMAKRKSANNDLQNIHIQIKIELHERCEEEFEDTIGSNQNP
jgi:hypothetical protein